MERLIIGTRGSALARTQSEWVAARLREAWPGLEVTLEIITTTGDKIRDVPLAQIGGKGLFTKEIEVALIEGRVDLAVHSLKDLPTELPPGLCLGAVPPRERPFDAFVSATAGSLRDLPHGARLGTSSMRRRLQLQALRPDLEIVDLRGNVPTRLRRVKEGELAATILAAAGLRRLGLAAAITEELGPEAMLPAVGQGALGIEIREGDQRVFDLLAVLRDDATAAETRAERALLAALGGGCQTPVGALGRAEAGRLTLHACICDPAGGAVLRTRVDGAVEEAEELGRRAAQALIDMGAGAFLACLDAPKPDPQPLCGRRIVVTRAAAQASDLVAAFEGLGAAVLVFPTIEIRPARVTAPCVLAGRFDWIVFTSRNGVMYFRQALEMSGIPEETCALARVCCVGPGTAEAAAQAGFSTDLVPDQHLGAAVAQALAAREGDLSGKRVLLPRGDLARPELPEALRALGAEACELVVYETVPAEIPEEAVAALLEFAPDMLVFTSGSTVQRFCERLGRERVARLGARAAVASIGPVTSEAARACGLEVAIEAASYDVPGLIEAVRQHAAERRTPE